MPDPLFFLLAVGFFAAVVVISLVLRRRRRTRESTSRSTTGPVEALTGTEKSRSKARWVVTLFFGLFLVAGLASLAPFVIMARGMVESWTWERTTCTVLESDVRTHSGSDGPTYSIDIRYRYRWGGRSYTADRYSFGFGSSSGREGKLEVVGRHPPGAEVPCWIDPSDPTEAVLHRRPGWELLLILVPLVFLAVGAAGVFGGRAVIGGELQRRDDWLPGTDAEEPPEERPAEALAEQASWMPTPAGRLEPSTSPRTRLLGSLVGALFWNGLVGVFAFFMLREGRPDGCALVFLGLFGVIGIFLLGLIPYYALALANPRPVLRLGDELVPGRTVRLSWSFSGRADRIGHLVLRLEGREKATYRRGTDTHTAEETFFEEVLVDTEQPSRIPAGEIAVQVPPDTMHSFQGGNNEIAWSLRLEGDIRRWPDLRETFPVTVFPEELSP